MPADQYITPPTAFRRTLGDAIELAATRHAVVVLGVVPDRPEPGYGYQQIGRPAGRGFQVVRFVEKPPLKTARRMVASGNFLWNAGMFVFAVRDFLSELGRQRPRLFGGTNSVSVE